MKINIIQTVTVTSAQLSIYKRLVGTVYGYSLLGRNLWIIGNLGGGEVLETNWHINVADHKKETPTELIDSDKS